jgi:mono/diheme cytochrome c family protein
MSKNPLRPLRILCALSVEILFLTSAAAQTDDGAFSSPSRFGEHDGAAIYRHICQGCHMKDAEGAVGAAAYPALAADPRLEQPGYAVLLVLNGLHSMPPFGATLSDAQVAAVVNYVRSNFGNHYGTDVTASDVASARH